MFVSSLLDKNIGRDSASNLLITSEWRHKLIFSYHTKLIEYIYHSFISFWNSSGITFGDFSWDNKLSKDAIRPFQISNLRIHSTQILKIPCLGCPSNIQPPVFPQGIYGMWHAVTPKSTLATCINYKWTSENVTLW